MNILDQNSFEIQKILHQIKNVEQKVGGMVLQAATKNWLTPIEVCGFLKVSMRTLRTYREDYGLGYSRIGDKIFFSTILGQSGSSGIP